MFSRGRSQVHVSAEEARVAGGVSSGIGREHEVGVVFERLQFLVAGETRLDERPVPVRQASLELAIAPAAARRIARGVLDAYLNVCGLPGNERLRRGKDSIVLR